MKDLLMIVLAIAFHGAGHCLFARAQGIRLRKMIPTATGLRLICENRVFPSYRAELLVALGGPIGNLVGNALFILLLFLVKGTPLAPILQPFGRDLLALSLFLGLWNLLPIAGFDGGCILRCFILDHTKKPCAMAIADHILSVTSAACFLSLWLLSLYLLLRSGRAFFLYLFCLQLFRGTYLESSGRANYRS